MPHKYFEQKFTNDFKSWVSLITVIQILKSWFFVFFVYLPWLCTLVPSPRTLSCPVNARGGELKYTAAVSYFDESIIAILFQTRFRLVLKESPLLDEINNSKLFCSNEVFDAEFEKPKTIHEDFLQILIHYDEKMAKRLEKTLWDYLLVNNRARCTFRVYRIL